ncbi:MAG: ABC transporter permease [Cyclobacteriaceae bacterium]|nr:ABC transporter permease [Cyclobacteriaceae bacterium]
MITNDIKIILRQLARNKSFSFINFIGLITSLTVCLFIVQFAWFEYSFERFNKNADRTYRLNLYNTSNGIFEGISKGTVSGLAYAMKQSLPGIEAIGRLSSKESAVVYNPDAEIRNLEGRIVFADPPVIDILAVNLRSGDVSKILRTAQSIGISESIATKYFGNTDAVGKLLEIGFPGADIEMVRFMVEGVFEDIPANTNEHFDIILPPRNEQAWNENWAWSNVTTYIRLDNHATPENLKEGLAAIVKQHHRDNTGDKYLLEPIRDIRLHALDGSGRATMVNFFIGLGLIVLLLAWFNYISLSTAKFLESMKEVGVRKLIGASRRQLIVRFLTESFVFNVISLLCAILLFAIIWPLAASYFQLESSISILQIPAAYLFLLAVLLAGVLISGLYPSLFLSSFKPLQSIKGKVNEFTDRSTLRKVLVVTQLTISLVLITAIFAIEKQINFIRNQNLGISLEQTLVIDSPVLTDATTVNKFELFRNEILRMSSVNGVTHASSFPGSEIDWHRADITLNEENAPYRYSSRIISIGNEFLDVFNLTVLTGRGFNYELESDRSTLLINEEASKMFGFANINDALGKVIFIGSRRFEIIGVIRNYHFRSLQHRLQPILYRQDYAPRGPSYAIKIASQDIPTTISGIEKRWKEAYPGNVFSYYFLDERFDQQYSSDKQVGMIVGILTFLAVIVSFLGLFGLSLYTVNRRIREIGIRKVFGASAFSIVSLLSKDYARLVIVGCIIGVPVVYLLIKEWLHVYAYQMPLDISLFLFPVLILVVLTALTVGIKTLQSANLNPVKSLRNE